MKRAVLIAITVIALIPPSWALVSYGTVLPCHIAAKEMVRQSLALAASELPSTARELLRSRIADSPGRRRYSEQSTHARLKERGLLWCTQALVVLRAREY